MKSKLPTVIFLKAGIILALDLKGASSLRWGRPDPEKMGQLATLSTVRKQGEMNTLLHVLLHFFFLFNLAR